MSANYKGNAEKPISSEYLYNTIKDFKTKADDDYATKGLEHTHSNKEDVLDKFSVNTEGDLTFNGNIVNENSTAVTKHINDTDIHVNADFKSNTTTHMDDASIHMSTSEKELLNSAYQKPSDGIPRTDLSQDVQTEISKKANIEDLIDNETEKIKENLMDYSGIDHLNIKNIGTMSHDELEQILDNHVSNTVIHQTKSLGQLTVMNDDFLAGTMSNCSYNAEEGYLELNKSVDTDPIEYVTDEASYTSKVLNTGIENCPFVTFSWLGKYNSNYTNINAYIRYGSVSVVDDTWTDWYEVPYDKTITGMAQYCQAKVVFKTSNKFKNIILKNIVIYYGVDMGSELVDARTDLDGTIHSTLKMHLDNIETTIQNNAKTIANSKTLGLVQPEDKKSTDTNYTIPVKIDVDGKLYSVKIPATIDKRTNHWFVDDVDTGVVADISEIYKNIELIADPTEDNHIAKIKNIKNELYIEEERYTNEHYTLSETGLIIVADGYLSNPSTQVELSTVNSKLLSSDTHTYAVGEYVTLVPKDTVKETYSVEKYCTKDFVKGLIDGNSNIHQLSFVDVKANDVKYLDLEVGSIFTKSLIQAFKFIPGETNIVETLKSFNNADASNFNYRDGVVKFTDEGMGIQDGYELNRSKYNDELYITEAFNKDDFTDIKSII